MRFHHDGGGMSPPDDDLPTSPTALRRAVDELVAGDVRSLYERGGVHLAVVSAPTADDPDREVLYRVRITGTDVPGGRVSLEYLGTVEDRQDATPD